MAKWVERSNTISQQKATGVIKSEMGNKTSSREKKEKMREGEKQKENAEIYREEATLNLSKKQPEL